MGGVPPPPAQPPPPEPSPEEADIPIELESIAPSSAAADGAESLSPESLGPDVDDLVLRWDASLDAIDYFTLLRLSPPSAQSDLLGELQVRSAFHGFALAFHPDRYRNSPDAVREAATRVYCRGAEAYRVLLDPLLRRRYARLLAEDGKLRMPQEDVADAVRRGDVGELADLVKSAGARPFAVRADELVAKGDLRQARLQLRLAMTKEPHNARLEEKMRELEEQIGKGSIY